MFAILFANSFTDQNEAYQVLYVTPSGKSKNCPINSECHTISYYASSNFSNMANVTFIFMEGYHFLNSSFRLENIRKLSLIGQGQWVIGPHWSTKQSTVVIKCTAHSKIAIKSSDYVYIHKLTVTNCGAGFQANHVENFHMSYVSIQNSTFFGLFYNASDSSLMGGIIRCTIFNTSFYKNCLGGTVRNSCSHAAFFSYSIPVVYMFNDSSVSYGEDMITGLLFSGDKGDTTDNHEHIELYLTNCLFYNNSGIISGGINVIIHSILLRVESTAFIKNNVRSKSSFISNQSPLSGAMALSIFHTNTTLHFDNCLFEGNEGKEAGGLYVLVSSSLNDYILYIHQTIFKNNRGRRGSALAIASSGAAIVFSDVVISSNTYHKELPALQYSALYLNCHSFTKNFVYIINITLANNDITGLLSIGCKLVFGNKQSFIINNTSPQDGGGMWIDQRSTITSWNLEGTIVFSNNSANERGGALYSESNPFRFSKSMKEALSMLPGYCQFADILGVFESNTAGIAGSDIYGGEFYECRTTDIISSDVDFLQFITCSFSWRVLYSVHKPLSSHISSIPYGACYCESDKVNCHNRTVYKSVYPGQFVTLSLVTVGMCGGISPGILATESNGIGIYLLTSNQQTTSSCKLFSYQLKYINTDNGSFAITCGTYQLKESSLEYKVQFLPCPAGFQLHVKSGICSCNDAIDALKSTNCNISLYPTNHSISRSGNNWLAYNYQHNCTIAHRNCPFDYCYRSSVFLNISVPDVQCQSNRTGTLCGMCQSGLSVMLGSNRCGKCTNYYLFLIPVFAVAGLALTVLLLRLNLTVSSGTINGLLFYANIMKLNMPVLFPNDDVPVLGQFIAWLNLDFGFNVCFFNGLDGYWKTWLQYSFSLILIVFILLCCKYSGKLSRLFGRNVVATVSTLTLMAHSKILLTNRNALMFTIVYCGDMHWNVWSVDGNIQYLSPKHIPLFIVSVLLLLAGLAYTLAIFLSQWLQYYCGKYCKSWFDPYVRLKPFIDAYTGPYKDKYRFWRGIPMMVHLTLTALFAYTTGILPQVNNYVTALVSFLLLAFIKGKYKDKKNTALEFFYLLNLGLTSLLNTINDDSIKLIVNSISIGLSLVVFTVTVLARLCLIIIKRLKCRQKFKINASPSSQSNNKRNEEEDEEVYSPSFVISKREPLIFDDFVFKN